MLRATAKAAGRVDQSRKSIVTGTATGKLVRCDALEPGALLGSEVRSKHWFPYDPVRVVNADP